jgi:hypothetical protein
MRVNNQRDRVMGRKLHMCTLFYLKWNTLLWLYFISKRLFTHRQWILVLLITYCLFIQASPLALSYYCSRVSNSDSWFWLTDHLLNSLFTALCWRSLISFAFFGPSRESTMLFNFLSLLNKCFMTGIVRLVHVWLHSMAGRCFLNLEE